MKMHTKILASSLILLPLAFAAGCNDDDDTTETGQKLETTPDELRGTWKTDCLATTALKTSATEREYVFNAIGDFDKVERFYSDANCQTLVATYKVIGTVEAKGKNPDSSDPDLEMINFTVNNASLKLNSDTLISGLNTLKFCGKSDWAVDQEVDVTNADCDGSIVQKGSVQFDSYDVRDGQLYFGSKFLFLAKGNAADRPTTLDTKVQFHKQ